MKISDKLKAMIERDTGLVVRELFRNRTLGYLRSLGVPLWLAICDGQNGCATIGSRATMRECVEAGAIKYAGDTELGFVDLVVPDPPNDQDQACAAGRNRPSQRKG